MDDSIKKELEELRAFKKANSKSAIDIAFEEIEETLLKNPGSRGFDCQMPVVAFRILANALILLKKEIFKNPY